MTNQQQQTAQEVVFYQDTSHVFISSTRAILLNQTFILRNIASVGMEKIQPGYIWEALLMVVAFGSLFLGVTADLSNAPKALLFIGAGLIALVVSAVLLIRKSPYHALVIGVSGNQVQAMTSKNPQYIATLVNALNAALAYRY